VIGAAADMGFVILVVTQTIHRPARQIDVVRFGKPVMSQTVLADKVNPEGQAIETNSL
jgi:hypothetical protein